ncbi:MAG: hypothetical protein JRI77_17850, partial [Deltaproteobacteria bacterium]|nr:hypothetical protein [Deltaproteobacteria bacterium]
MQNIDRDSPGDIVSIQPQPPQRIGPMAWLGVYFTGILLLFFLLVHIWMIHYA